MTARSVVVLDYGSGNLRSAQRALERVGADVEVTADHAAALAADGLVGAPYDALKQACYGAQRDRLLLVQYETLTTDPGATMRAIYDFIGEPEFAHDFDHVDYDVAEFDERAGTPGLHTVRPTVQAQPRETLLPPDLFNRFIHDAFWRDPQRIPTGLRIV